MNEKQLPCTKDSQYICLMREVEGAYFECAYKPEMCYWRRKGEPRQEELLSKGKK